VKTLEAEGMSKRFGGVQAVSDVSFSVDPGQIFAVIGPNGAGKTTLLNLLTGLMHPDAGRVQLDGKDITGFAPYRNARLGMARTLQAPVVFPTLTVLENVMMGRLTKRRPSYFGALVRAPGVARWEREAKAKARETLELLELEPFADRIATELPAGQQRLVEIARALTSEPKLMLLDEPAAGLAQPEVVRLAHLIRSAQERGISVCLVEHNMALVMGVAERILVVHHGKTLFEGTASEARNHPEVIAAYLGSARGAEASDAVR
jgi:branched-chain amino acid transport system ATP-binding protein